MNAVKELYKSGGLVFDCGYFCRGAVERVESVTDILQRTLQGK